MKTFRVEIVNAEQEMFSGQATKLFVTGALGELEVLAGHAPLLTTLTPGPVWLSKPGGEEEALVILGGILEVQPGVATILADAAIRADDIDSAAAMAAKRSAEAALAGHEQEFDYELDHVDIR